MKPFFKVPEAILIQTLEKGTESLAMRRKAEYHLFTRSEYQPTQSTLSLNSSLPKQTSLQTWGQTQNQPKELLLLSHDRIKRRFSSLTPPFSSSTPPGCSSTPSKSKYPAPTFNFLPIFLPIGDNGNNCINLPPNSLSLFPGRESRG